MLFGAIMLFVEKRKQKKMTPPQKVIATEAQLKSFDWLPIEQWSVDNLFNYYGVEGKKLCKVCDKWVSVGDLGTHVSKHKAARISLKKKEAEEARSGLEPRQGDPAGRRHKKNGAACAESHPPWPTS